MRITAAPRPDSNGSKCFEHALHAPCTGIPFWSRIELPRPRLFDPAGASSTSMLSFENAIRALARIDCLFDAVRVTEQYLKMHFTRHSLAIVEKLFNFHVIFKK